LGCEEDNKALRPREAKNAPVRDFARQFFCCRVKLSKEADAELAERDRRYRFHRSGLRIIRVRPRKRARVCAWMFFNHFRVRPERWCKNRARRFPVLNSWVNSAALDAIPLASVEDGASRSEKGLDLPLHLGYSLDIHMSCLFAGASLTASSAAANFHENHKGSFTSNFKLTSVSVR
jgi:hypothetical protein